MTCLRESADIDGPDMEGPRQRGKAGIAGEKLESRQEGLGSYCMAIYGACWLWELVGDVPPPRRLSTGTLASLGWETMGVVPRTISDGRVFQRDVSLPTETRSQRCGVTTPARKIQRIITAAV